MKGRPRQDCGPVEDGGTKGVYLFHAFTKKKAITAACLVVAAVAAAAVLLFLPGGEEVPEDPLTAEAKEDTIKAEVMTLTDRTACLKQYGWLVDRASEVEKEVRIPQEFDEVYADSTICRFYRAWIWPHIKGET